MTEDMVNKPPHYTDHPIFTSECWDYAQTLENGAEFSAFRYAFRYASKHNPVQDVEKALWYLDQIIANSASLQPVTYRLNAGKAPWKPERAGAIIDALDDLSDSEAFESASYADQVAAQACLEILLGLDPQRAREHLEDLHRELTGEYDAGDEWDDIKEATASSLRYVTRTQDLAQAQREEAVQSQNRLEKTLQVLADVSDVATVYRESEIIPPREPEKLTIAQKWRKAMRKLK